MVKKNIGKWDRIFRLAIAVLLAVLAWLGSSWLLLAAAIFALYEAVAGWCVFYALTGKNSCEK